MRFSNHKKQETFVDVHVNHGMMHLEYQAAVKSLLFTYGFMFLVCLLINKVFAKNKK